MQGKKLTREQQQYIVDHTGSKTPQEIAEVIGCTPGTVNRYAVKLGARLRRFKMDDFRGGGIAEPLRTPIKRPNLQPGQRIRVWTKEDKGEAREKRDAEVVEVYQKFAVLQIDGKNDVPIRIAADYFDLATEEPIVI